MNLMSEVFFRTMLKFLPWTSNEYNNSIERKGKLLETVVIEDIFMPEIIKLLKENKEKKLLGEIFNFFEEVSEYGDQHLVNIFSITVLEILGNENVVLEVAKMYMGPKTTELQIEADRGLGRL